MPEQKYAGQSENRYRRKRRYGWHVFQLLLVLWIPSLPVVSHWFGTSLWIPAGYWALTLFAVYQLLPQIHVPGSLRQQMAVQGYVWSGAGIYLAIRYGMGVVLKSLAASPYDHSPLGLAGNAVGTFLSLAFREYTRAYGIGTIYRLEKAARSRGILVSCVFHAALGIDGDSIEPGPFWCRMENRCFSFWCSRCFLPSRTAQRFPVWHITADGGPD